MALSAAVAETTSSENKHWQSTINANAFKPTDRI